MAPGLVGCTKPQRAAGQNSGDEAQAGQNPDKAYGATGHGVIIVAFGSRRQISLSDCRLKPYACSRVAEVRELMHEATEQRMRQRKAEGEAPVAFIAVLDLYAARMYGARQRQAPTANL